MDCDGLTNVRQSLFHSIALGVTAGESRYGNRIAALWLLRENDREALTDRLFIRDRKRLHGIPPGVLVLIPRQHYIVARQDMPSKRV
jgi:hypothetical protein